MFSNLWHAINLQLVRRFAELGIHFAFPTQTLYLNRTPAKPELGRALASHGSSS